MKKKPDRYIYPAVFSYEPGEEISVMFPDLDVATSGVDDDDVVATIFKRSKGRFVFAS